ncbi:hypothetical protein JXJ21_26075 [candidate division KSB1 bacterium]|nr:hypothetical protein [candidate division KSB1 bacterium]
MEKFQYNLHIHSAKSNCAKPEMTLPAIMDRALSADFDLIGISDHIDLRERPADFLFETKAEIDALNPPIPILAGCETTQIAPHVFALSDETAQALDYVIVACNHYHLPHVEQPPDPTLEAFASHHFQMLEGAILWKYTDIIAHPFCPRVPEAIRNDFDFERLERSYSEAQLRNIILLACQHDVAFEINPGYYFRMPRVYKILIAEGKKAGLKFSPGTDAHSLSSVDFSFHFRGKDSYSALMSAFGLRWSDIRLKKCEPYARSAGTI